MISKQDKELALAAIALYRAAEHACIACELTDKEFANWCIQYACKSLEEWEVYNPDTPTITTFVHSTLHLDIAQTAPSKRV